MKTFIKNLCKKYDVQREVHFKFGDLFMKMGIFPRIFDPKDLGRDFTLYVHRFTDKETNERHEDIILNKNMTVRQQRYWLSVGFAHLITRPYDIDIRLLFDETAIPYYSRENKTNREYLLEAIIDEILIPDVYIRNVANDTFGNLYCHLDEIAEELNVSRQHLIHRLDNL